MERALDSIYRAAPPRRARCEIIVVNNNCTDGTDAVVTRLQERLPITLLHEPKPGLSNARNAAVDAASGDYIIWTDDDVQVCVDWIVEYERAFARWPEASVFGGPICPLFEDEPPDWLRTALPYVGSAFAIRDLRIDMVAPMTSTSPELPYGANFAVRMREQRRFRCDPQLGRRPGELIITGEETATIRAILAEGGNGRWLPSATVDHYIPRSRQTTAYLRSYYYGCGWMLGCNLKVGQGIVATLTLWCLALIKELRYRVYRVTAGPQKWVWSMASAAAAWGTAASSKRRNKKL